MRILIVVKAIRGGVGRTIKNVTKESKKRGHQIDVISREDDLHIDSFLGSILPIRNKVAEMNKEKNYDIIYTQDWSMALPLLFPYPIYNKKHYLLYHGVQVGISTPIQNIIGHFMKDKLIVVGDPLKNKFPKAHLVYSGVNLDEFRPLNKPRRHLGWINKTTETLTKKECINLSKKLKLKPLIIKNTSIKPENMNKDFYNKCKVFISLPPKSAGFNLCWIEAMAAGVPIIIGNNEGIGIKLPINKVYSKKDLDNCVEHLANKDYRKVIKNSDLTWKKHTEKVLKILESNKKN